MCCSVLARHSSLGTTKFLVLQRVTGRRIRILCVAVCCSVLQCVAVCCSVFLRYSSVGISNFPVLHCVAVFRIILQDNSLDFDSVCCSVLQCVAAVAVCSSV